MTPGVTRLSVPDERGHEGGRREVVDLGRRADLLDPALAHDHDPVGQRERLLLVVGDVDRGDPELALDRSGSPCAGRSGSWRRAPTAVRRAAGPGARWRARGRARRAAAGRPTAATDSGRRGPRRCISSSSSPTRLVDLGLRALADLEPEADVVGDGHVREERVRLEDHPDVALVRRPVGDVLAVDRDRAGGRLLEARRSSAASSSCRSRTGRGTTRTRRGRRRG